MSCEASDPKAVAERFNLSTKTVLRALRSGELRGAKFGSRWQILDADATAWFDSKVPTAADIDPAPVRPPLRRSRRNSRASGGLRAFVNETQGGQAA